MRGPAGSLLLGGLLAVCAPVRAQPAEDAPQELQAYRPNPALDALATFRLARSADVEWIPFREPSDPMEPPGALSLADVLRLSGAIRTRELSQGPTAETFAIRGAGSGRAVLLFDGGSLAVPGTSGPHTHEVMLSEIESLAILRGGAGALYGPEAASGAVVVRRRFPLPEKLLSRAVAEEGVDGYQRASFQVGRQLGSRGAFHVTTESRRIEGFFPGTKEVDRHFAALVRGSLPRGLEASLSYRRFEGDGRSGGFDPGQIRGVLTKRGEYRMDLLFPYTAGRGALLEVDFLRERLETMDGSEPLTREIEAPTGRVTSDLPDWAGCAWVLRAEATRWRIARLEEQKVEHFWRAGAALRATRRIGERTFLTGTLRADMETRRRRALQARLEGEWAAGPCTVFAVTSRGEWIPDREAPGGRNEVHASAEGGMRAELGEVRLRLGVFYTRIRDLRPEPTFEQVRARAPVLEEPVGRARIRGGTFGLETGRFALPRLHFLGRMHLRSNLTRLRAENLDTGARLPSRARLAWTGEGSLERRFFDGELLARVRGRLTHRGGRVDAAGAAVTDMWLNDVILEGEVGDVVFFYRFHDLLERADEVEPGIRFPGFSRMYGITWRFWG